MKKQVVAAIAVSAMVTAIVISGISSRTGDLTGLLLGNVGILPLTIATITVFFLAFNSSIASRTLERAVSSFNLARQSDVANRYQKGMEMLASENVGTRIGGIYLLQEVVVADASTYWASVVHSLVAYLNVRCADEREAFLAAPKAKRPELKPSPEDLVIAMKLIGSADPRVRRAIESLPPLDVTFQGLVLSGVYLSNVSYVGADFEHCLIYDVGFSRSDFSRVGFSADAHSVRFDDCSLAGAFLLPRDEVEYAWVDATQCDLTGCALSGTEIRLFECDLTDTEFRSGRFLVDGCWYHSPPRREGRFRVPKGAVSARNRRTLSMTDRGMPVLARRRTGQY